MIVRELCERQVFIIHTSLSDLFTQTTRGERKMVDERIMVIPENPISASNFKVRVSEKFNKYLTKKNKDKTAKIRFFS